MEKTIAAISTAQAPGAIGIIRLSGPEAVVIADRIFQAASGKALAQAAGYTAHYGHVFDQGEKIDEAVALVFRAPKSYTGEEVVELSCHGGLYLTRRVLRAALAAGAQPAAPGEFTKRAFLNGKMDLPSAEAVMQMIGVKGESAARMALSEREGALSRRVQAVREHLLASAAHLDAWADFPEEEIPEVQEEPLAQNLKDVLRELEALLARYDAGKAIREGVETVILGRPNVGKSTLMNLLAGAERSIVTEVAGTTRDVVEETVRLGQVLLRLADTAGLRETDDPVERIGVDRARARLRSAELVLAVFDSSEALNQEDFRLLEEVQGIPCIAVVNKSDLPKKIDDAYLDTKIAHRVTISATDGMGLSALAQAVEGVLGTAGFEPSAGALFTERQRQAAQEAAGCLQEALAALASGMTLDAVTVSIEAAAAALCHLTGERVTDAVVDEVFSHFCVGK